MRHVIAASGEDLTNQAGMRRSAQADGFIRFGCLVSLAAMALFVLVSYKTLPLLYHASEFQQAVELEVGRAAAKRLPDATLKKSILSQAAVYKVPLTEKDFKLVRSSDRLAVEVQYSVPVEFPFYTHVFNFQFRVESIVGAL